MTGRFALRSLAVLFFTTPALLVATSGAGCGGQVAGTSPDGTGTGPGGSGTTTCAQVCNGVLSACGDPSCLSSCTQAQDSCDAMGEGAAFETLLTCLAGLSLDCQNGSIVASPASLQALMQCEALAQGSSCSGSMVMPGPGPGPAPTPTTNPPPPPTPGPPSCASVCARFQQQCGAEPQCLGQCEMIDKECSAVGQSPAFQDLLSCIETAPFTCGTMGTENTTDCQSQANIVAQQCALVAEDGGVMVTDAGAGPG